MAAGKRRTNLEASVEALTGMEGGSWFKPQAGKNVVRILPAFHTKGPYAGIFYNKKSIHSNIVIEGKNRTIACCRNWKEFTSCPVCDFKDALIESGDTKNGKLGKKMSIKENYYINVLDRKSGKIMKWKIGKSIMKQFRGYLIDSDYGDLTDPEEGRDITVEKSGEGLSTKYELRPKAKESAIGVDGWEDQMFDVFADGECVEKQSPGEVFSIMKDSYGKLFTSMVKPPKGAKSSADDDDDNEAEEEEGEETVDLDEMDRDALKKFIKEKELDVRVTKSMSDDDIREKIAEALEEPPFSTEEEEEDD